MDQATTTINNDDNHNTEEQEGRRKNRWWEKPYQTSLRNTFTDVAGTAHRIVADLDNFYNKMMTSYSADSDARWMTKLDAVQTELTSRNAYLAPLLEEYEQRKHDLDLLFMAGGSSSRPRAWRMSTKTPRSDSMLEKLLDMVVFFDTNVQQRTADLFLADDVRGSAAHTAFFERDGLMANERERLEAIQPFVHFANGSRAARALSALFEELSGAVRVFVRFNENVTASDEVLGINRTMANKGRFTLESDILWPSNTLHSFGPFYDVAVTRNPKQQEQNNNRSYAQNNLNVKELAAAIDRGCNLCLFTYGYSGSGKTFTLFGNLFDEKQQQQQQQHLGPNAGCVFFLVAALVARGYKVRMHGVDTVYGYLQRASSDNEVYDRQRFEATRKSTKIAGTIEVSDEKDMGVFMNQVRDQMNPHFQRAARLVDEGVDNFIKTTPNNIQSSRGFMIVSFDVLRQQQSGQPPRRLCIVDTAGNEDPLDLLMSMSPLSYIPSVENSFHPPFFMRTTPLQPQASVHRNRSTAAALLPTRSSAAPSSSSSSLISQQKSLQSAQSTAITTSDLSDARQPLPASNLLATSSYAYNNVVINRVCNQIIQNMKSTMTKLATLKSSLNDDYFGKVNDRAVRNGIKQLIMYLKREQQRQPPSSGNTKAESVVPAISASLDLVCTLACLIMFIHDVLTKKPKLNTSYGHILRHVVYVMMLCQDDNKTQGAIDDVIKAGSVDHATWDGFMSEDKGKGMGSTNEWVGVIKKKLVGEGRDKHHGAFFYPMWNEIGGKPVVSIGVDTAKFTAMCREFVAKVVWPVKERAKGEWYTLFKEALKKRQVEKASQLSLSKFLEENSDIMELSTSSTSPSLQLVKLGHNDVISIPASLQSVDVKLKFPLPPTSDNNSSSGGGGGNLAVVKPEYVERIIREGYFINQANAELMTFLEDRITTGQGRASPGQGRPPPCERENSVFYLEEYDIFSRTICKQAGSPSATTLVDTIRQLMETPSALATKYILVTALRKEREGKFRLGAIDTVRLVEKLKST